MYVPPSTYIARMHYFTVKQRHNSLMGAELFREDCFSEACARGRDAVIRAVDLPRTRPGLRLGRGRNPRASGRAPGRVSRNAPLSFQSRPGVMEPARIALTDGPVADIRLHTFHPVPDRDRPL